VRGQRDPERLGRLDVDRQYELRWILHRDAPRRRTVQNGY
jgi:hypothetical protein